MKIAISIGVLWGVMIFAGSALLWSASGSMIERHERDFCFLRGSCEKV